MTGLRQMDDEVAQLSALSELNELLSISTEDNLATFPIESMVPLLVRCPAVCRRCKTLCGCCTLELVRPLP